VGDSNGALRGKREEKGDMLLFRLLARQISEPPLNAEPQTQRRTRLRYYVTPSLIRGKFRRQAFPATPSCFSPGLVLPLSPKGSNIAAQANGLGRREQAKHNPFSSPSPERAEQERQVVSPLQGLRPFPHFRHLGRCPRLCSPRPSAWTVGLTPCAGPRLARRRRAAIFPAPFVAVRL